MTRRANSKNIDVVTRLGESVGLGYLICPFFHLVGLNFNGFSAISAD
jgi:hypothetical protein